FFFSSRSRHTRFSRDWSSDVCSSDLRAQGGPDRAGEPALPVRPARPPPWPAAGQRHGRRRPGRLRGCAGQAVVGRPEKAPVAGAHVAVAGAAVVARRTVRQPRPGRTGAGQPHDPGAPARRRRCPAHDPRRLRGPAGTHPRAGVEQRATGAAAMMFSAARALVARDLRLLWRRRGDAMQPALFALLVLVLFALGLGSDRKLLGLVAGGVLWVAVLLSGLLALDTLFRGDA